MKQLAHEKLMQEEGLTFSDLPADAQTALNKLKKTLRGIKLTEGQGRKVSKTVFDEVEMLDKVITREILESLDGKKKTPPPPPTPPPADPPQKTPEEIASEKKKQDDAEAERLKAEEATRLAKETEEATRQKEISEALAKKAPAINKELKAAVESGPEILSFEQLKASAPTVYSLIFENYEKAGENGIETSSYSCIETGTGTGQFKLSKI